MHRNFTDKKLHLIFFIIQFDAFLNFNFQAYLKNQARELVITSNLTDYLVPDQLNYYLRLH